MIITLPKSAGTRRAPTRSKLWQHQQAPALLNTVSVLTFDVFGTLFDWEDGVSKGLAEAYVRERKKAGNDVAGELPIGDEGPWLRSRVRL